MYHKKQWLFQDDETTCAVHGSGNVTTRGLLVNGEQMTVDKPWSDGLVAERRVALLSTQWDRQWENKHPHSLTITAEQGLLLAGSIRPPESMPTIDDFWQAWRRDAEAGLESTLPPGLRSPPEHLLRIPSGMDGGPVPTGTKVALSMLFWASAARVSWPSRLAAARQRLPSSAPCSFKTSIRVPSRS